MADKRDYYEVLGVSKDADEAALKKAYRQLAKQYHPDMHPDDPECEAKFKEATEAYGVLSDPEKRRQYDQYGHAAFDGSGGGSAYDFSGMDFSDIFGDLFGGMFGGGFGGFGGGRGGNGPAKGASLRARVHISFEQAVTGCTKDLEITLKEECENCKGSGCAPGTSKTTCSKCGGKGRVVVQQQTLFGMMQNVSTCPDCSGTGEKVSTPCPKCNGSGYVSKKKTLSVDIPAGIDDGQSIRLSGKGEPGRNGGPRGDLLVEVSVSRSDKFERDGVDIYSQVSISYAQAALGSEIIIETVDGKVAYEVKAGTQPGTRIRLRGKGMPSVRNKSMRGDHYVTLQVAVPTTLTAEAKEALRAYDAVTGNTLKGTDTSGAKKAKKGFMDKVKEVIDEI